MKKIIFSGSGARKFLLRNVAILFALLTLGIGNAWAESHTYGTAFTAATSDTGKGLVYASGPDTNTAPANDAAYGASGNGSPVSDTGGSSNKKSYYAYAKAARGYAFDKWELTSSNSNKGVSVNTATKADGATITVTSNVEDGTNTGTATAKWKNDPNAYTVTFGVPKDGSYTVTYSYTTIENNAFTTGGFNFSMTEISTTASGQKTSYKDDAVTVATEATNFEGWYDNASFTGTALSTDKSYSFTVSGATSVYAKFTAATKYFGQVNASIAAVPNSMPGGGTIYISDIAGTSGVTFSENAQTAKITSFNSDATPPASVNQTYYLYAQPNDKRYVFRGWYDNATCTGTPLSTNASWAYTFAVSSHAENSPTAKTVYAAFDFNLYYMQVEVEPGTASQGLGMVIVSDQSLGTPEYTQYASYAEQFLYAYRLAPTANAYLYAKAKYGYKFSGWYDNAACTGTALSTANPYTYAATGTSTDPMNPTIVPVYAKFVEDASTINITYNLPDQTKGEYTASVLDIVEVDDEYVWTFTEVFTSAGKTANTTQAQHKSDVLRLEAACKAGCGVTSWTDAGTAKTTPSHLYQTTGTATGKTYGVAFGDAKPFMVSAASATTGTQYATLAEALSNLGSNNKITVVQNAYVPAGNYTIPSGVTLLVPYNTEYAINTTPSTVKEGTPNASAYVTLTLGDGAVINVNGSVCVNTVMCLTMGYNGQAMGKYGLIDMQKGSQMKFNSGTNCYAWGYIIGEGSIVAESGSTMHETFQFAHRGGSALSAIVGGGLFGGQDSRKVFPINQYYIQSIEAPITIKKGATETVYTGVHNVNQAVSIDFIGTSGLFQMTGTNAYLVKRYDVSLDRQEYTLYGDATISSIEFGMSGFSEDSKNFTLPITNNMTLNVESGTTTIQYETALLPDVQIDIASGAKIQTSSDCYVYDSLHWKGAYAYACQYSASDQVSTQIRPIKYRPGGLKYKRVDHKLRDVKIDVQGELRGIIYTTDGGANITSSGSGKVSFSAARQTAATYQVGQDNTSPSWDSYSITSALLKNGDGSYVQTADATTSDNFLYSKNMQQWMKNPKTVTWNANGGTTEATAMAYSEGQFIGELPAAYKEGHTLAGWFTAADGGTQIAPTNKVTANTTYYAHWTPKVYNITYMDQGKVPFSGTHVDEPNAHPTKHTYGKATTLNGVNNKANALFDGWYTISNCKAESKVTSLGATAVSKDITLYAKWIPLYTLTISATPAGYGTVSAASIANVPEGSAVTTSGNTLTVNGTTVTATPTAETAQYTYTFDNWNKVPATVTEAATIQAVFTRATRSYNITFNMKGHGSAIDGQTKEYGSKVDQPSDPSEDGYTFVGWYKEDACTNAWNFVSDEVKGATTLYAKWTLNKVTVTWDATTNGGKAASPATTEVTPGEAVGALATTSKEGYSYKWYTESTGGTEVTAATIVSEDKTFYAQFTEITHEVTLAYKYGSTSIKDNESVGGVGITTAQSVTAPDITGYTFANWTLTDGVTSVMDLTNASININATADSKTITANYTINTHKLEWDFDEGATSSSSYTPNNNALAFSSTITYPANNTMIKTGYTFAGWSSDATSMPDADLTITASWTANTNTAYKVEHYKQNVAGDGYDLEETDNLTGTTGASVTPAVKSYEGFDAPVAQTVTILADGSRVVEYKYTRKSYDLSWVTDGNALTGSYTHGSTKYGATITAPNTPTKTGCVFAGWHDGTSVVTPAATMPAAATTYTATFVATNIITWKVEGQPDVTQEVALGAKPVYPNGTPSKASTDELTFTFDGWSDGTTSYGKDETLPSVTGPATYTAKFTSGTRFYTITWLNKGGEVLTTTTGAWHDTPAYPIVDMGGTPTYTDGSYLYQFKGWNPEVSEINGDNTYTAQYDQIDNLVVSEDQTIIINATVTTTTVKVDGKLNVSGGKTLSTGDLILEATPANSGEITGNVNATEHAYFEFSQPGGFKAKTWYAVAVPWQVDASWNEGYTQTCGISAKRGSAFEPLALGRQIDLIYYDGGERAKNGHSDDCWKYVELDSKNEVMLPGRAYMFLLLEPADVVRFERNEGAELHTNFTSVARYDEKTNNGGQDANWNGIANPATFKAYLNAGTIAGYKYNGSDRTYALVDMDKAEGKLPVGQSVYVQAPSAKTVTANATSYAAAPRRIRSTEQPVRYDVYVSGDENFSDRVIIRADEEKEEDIYTIGEDLVKFEVSSHVPQMWVERYNSQLGVNTALLSGNTALFPLGISVPQTGEYTISVNDKMANEQMENDYMLYLTIDGRSVWNITYAPYTTTLEKGTTNRYGLKLVRNSNAPAVTTDIQDVQAGTQQAARKVLLDGQVYILRGNEMYSVDGRIVK